jgi:Protein of unknown function (DUF2971)
VPAEIIHAEPKCLYRYRSLNRTVTDDGTVRDRLEEELSALRDKYIYCAGYDSLNDPMEGLFRPTIQAKSSEKWPENRKMIDEEKGKWGIAALGEAWDDQLLWAHYADGFRGICVAYNRNVMVQDFESHLSLTRITYTAHPNTISTPRPKGQSEILNLLSKKSTSWAYEREWRLFSPIIGKNYYESSRLVDHVYLGTRMPPKTREHVTAALDSLNIEVRPTVVIGYAIQRKMKGLRVSQAD